MNQLIKSLFKNLDSKNNRYGYFLLKEEENTLLLFSSLLRDTIRDMNNDTNANIIGDPKNAPSDTSHSENKNENPLSQNYFSSEFSEEEKFSPSSSETDTSSPDLSHFSENTQKPNSLEDLRSEIDSAFQTSKFDTPSTPRNDPLADTPNHFEENKKDDFSSPETEITKDAQSDIMMSNHETLMNDLRTSIDSDFETPEENNIRRKGVENTYYEDVSEAMGSNDPKTMSELIQKSRFEEEETKILSPRSKKNIFFITGALLLLVVSIGILSLIFGGSGRSVQFISGERVASLVYSNQDTGINVTRLETAQTRQAIRKAVEMKIPNNTINQIYYAEEVGGNVMRRLGIQDILQRTENLPPEILLNSLRDDFMHGVYSTDKNHPFLILKTNSYDRAFEGMKEWEPRMIDDLSAYFDLPSEANDRSLIQDGFEDDLIRNKNVRVARFLPREVDRRGIFRIFDALRFNQGSSTEIEDLEESSEEIEGNGSLGFLERSFVERISPTKVYAQTPVVTGTGFSGTGGSQLVCYNNAFPGQVFPQTYQNELGYYCVSVLAGEGALGQITVIEPICFDVLTGQRLPTGNPATDFCFQAYKCNPYVCRLNGNPVSSSQQGNPGVICREESSLEFVAHDDPQPKICRQFNDLVMLQNINNANLCFDQNGTYLPNVTQVDGSMDGVTCIVPQNRTAALCMTNTGQIYDPSGPDAPLYDANRKFCFQRLDTSVTGIGVNEKCADLTVPEIQAKLAAAAQELRFIALLAGALGVSNQDVQNMNEFADILMDIAQQNVLQIDVVRQVAFYLEQLEQLLNTLDPQGTLPTTGPNGGLNVYGVLRTVIDTVKCALGIANTLQWITLGQIEPNLFIFAGQSLPEVIPIQQSLVLMGLMDPVSVTGNLDLVTQDAISQFQLANGLNITGTINPETILVINAIIEGNGSIYGGEAIINDYFIVPSGSSVTTSGTIMALGSYTMGVQNLQILLYAEGYEILAINGLFDENTCLALQNFQQDEGLEIADELTCTVSPETFEALNNIIRLHQYLGSGFYLNPQGYLEGVGALEGTFGPGVFDYTVEADADTLREGDIVLMYMFLDEETILITRSQVVIDEIIQRRALTDIFQR